MKKKFAILLVLAVMISVSACGTPNDKPITTGSDVISESTEGLQSTYNDTSGLDADVIRPDAPQMSTTIPEETWPDLDGNPYTTHKVINGRTEVWFDYSEVYETLDLSQYTRWGSFGEDGLMWVEKSDYTGKRIGYIDYKGNEVIPLIDTIERACNFHNGLAIFMYEEDIMGNGQCAIIDTHGEILARFEKNATTKYNCLKNGNIIFSNDIEIQGGSYSGKNAYMFVKIRGDFVEVPVPAWQSIETIDYSDGLLLIYSNYYIDPGAKYFDEEGKCVLDLDNSSEYYKEVVFASDFVNGEATVNFVGMDGNWYMVQIDKSGVWKTDPERISKSDANTFSNTY